MAQVFTVCFIGLPSPYNQYGTPLAKHKGSALLREKSGKWDYIRKIVLTCLPRRSRTSCPCTCRECADVLWVDHWRTQHGTPPGDPRFPPRAAPPSVPVDPPSARRCALGTRAWSDGCSSRVRVVGRSGCASWSYGLLQCNTDVWRKQKQSTVYINFSGFV